MFIYWISGESGCLVSSTNASKATGQKFITHADYKALEAVNAKLEADFWRVTKQNAELIAQLAATSARENALADKVIHMARQLNELRTKYNLPKD